VNVETTTTPVNDFHQPLPSRTYGIHRFDSVIDIFCALRQESVGKIL